MEKLSLLLRSALLLGLALLLGGCPAVTLIEAENEWRSTYRGMVESGDPLTLSDANLDVSREKLKILTARAQAEGEKIVATDRATAIAFFRVAALAAWKSGIENIGPTDKAVIAGNKACAELGEKKPPRDCELFDYVQPFAAADISALRLARLSAKYPGTQPLPDDERRNVVETVNSGVNIVGKLAELHRATSQNPAIPPEFLATFVDENIRQTHCTFLIWATMYGKGDRNVRTPSDLTRDRDAMDKALPTNLRCPRVR